MKVDKHHPLLQALIQEVSGVGVKKSHTIAGRALPLQRRLVETVACLARPFIGQIALVYHEFQIRGPGIDRPVNDYWVRVARLPLQQIQVIDLEKMRDKEIHKPGHRLSDFKPRFLMQVVWQRPLYPKKSGQGDIEFVLERRRGFREEMPSSDNSIRHLDISALENDLFQTPVAEDRRRKSKITKEVVILFGTEEVEHWLGQHRSLDTFRALVVPKKTAA